MGKVKERRRPKVAILRAGKDEAEFETELAIRGSSLGLTIPAPLIEGMGLEAGSRVRVTISRRG